MMPSAGDATRASVFVAVPPAEAFRLFVDEIDLWWRRGPRFRTAGAHAGVIRIEPGVGGRLFEAWQVDGRDWVFETGRVVEWDPPRGFALEWRLSNFAPGESTRVEVGFADEDEGTRVTVVHRGWAGLRPDHPARHGEPAGRFVARHAQWWGALLAAFRVHARARCAAARPPGQPRFPS